MKKENKDLLQELIDRGDTLSRAEKMEMLISIQKGFLNQKQSMVDFQEPIMFFARRNGDLEFFDKVTQGKFPFKHSNGEQRYIEIRPQDQMKFHYGDRRVRCYFGHEDRPFTGFDDAILDTESINLAMSKISNTNSKYEEALLKEKNKGLGAKGKLIIYIAIAIAIAGFGVGTWLLPAIAKAKAQSVASQSIGAFLLIGSFKYSNALERGRQWLKR